MTRHKIISLILFMMIVFSLTLSLSISRNIDSDSATGVSVSRDYHKYKLTSKFWKTEKKLTKNVKITARTARRAAAAATTLSKWNDFGRKS